MTNPVEIDPEEFLTAGGRLTLSEWAGFSEEHRTAFVTAGDRIISRLAEETAEAIIELVGPAQSLEDVALDALAEAAGGAS